MRYFFEKGLNILKEKGIFAFICSNKFAKAKYGEKLRKLLLKNQLKIYNDFTGIKVFKEASVDTCVIQIKKDFNINTFLYHAKVHPFCVADAFSASVNFDKLAAPRVNVWLVPLLE